MNRQTGAARISIAPTKGKGSKRVEVSSRMRIACGGIRSFETDRGRALRSACFRAFRRSALLQQAFGAVRFVSGDVGLASGIDCVLVSAVQCAVMLGVSFVHIKCRRKINKWLLILYLAASQIFFVLFKTSESQELVNKLIAAGAGIVFSFVCIYVLRALFIRGLKYRLTVEENICLAVFALCVFKALDFIRVGGDGLLAFIAPLAVLLTLFVYGKSCLLRACRDNRFAARSMRAVSRRWRYADSGRSAPWRLCRCQGGFRRLRFCCARWRLYIFSIFTTASTA